MTYKGYKADIKFDSDANTFYGEILNSAAVIHFRGSSVEELEISFKEGIDEYLTVCEEEGITPERPFSGEFRVRISPDLHKKIFFQAKKEKLSINKFAIKAFEEKILSSEREQISASDPEWKSTISPSTIDTEIDTGVSDLDSTTNCFHFPVAV
jgi:predicted HicB family RNase H-like nuclease